MRKDAQTQDLRELLLKQLDGPEWEVSFAIDEALHQAWLRGFNEGVKHARNPPVNPDE